MEIPIEERQAILNREIAAYVAVNPRVRSVVDRTDTTAHLKNEIRENLLYLSVFGCVFTVGISLLIDIPLRILVRLFGKKVHDQTTISVLPDGTVETTNF